MKYKTIKLSKENKIKLFDFLCNYENKLSHFYGHYIKLDNELLVKFCESNSIIIGTLCTTNLKKRNKYKYYVLFESHRPSKFRNLANDPICNLLGHIRNSIAHSNITTSHKTIFELKDYDKNQNENMIGKIKADLLFQIIDIISTTYE